MQYGAYGRTSKQNWRGDIKNGNNANCLCCFGKIKPYKNNPRNNNKAVEKVMKSIQAYGFKVPCVLDKNYLLITGHTRCEAAKRLKMKKIPCIIASDLSKAKADAFRIADNKVAEYSKWDINKLKDEISKL